MSTTSGACVRRARLAAADGIPMPTKHTMPLRSRRAASMVMISVAVYAVWTASGMNRSVVPGDSGTRVGPRLHGDDNVQRLQELRVVLRPQHVLLHPREERLAIARDRIPRLAERVVADVVAVRVARVRAERNLAHRGKRPVRQQARVH